MSGMEYAMPFAVEKKSGCVRSRGAFELQQTGEEGECQGNSEHG